MRTKNLILKPTALKDIDMTCFKTLTHDSNLIEPSNSHTLCYLLTLLETQESIGYIQIRWLNENETCGYLQFGLNANRELDDIKEALELLIPTLFQQGIYRLETALLENNLSTEKILKELHFEYEGNRCKAFYQNENYLDIHLFGRIKSYPSTNLQDYVSYVTPYYRQPEFLYSLLHNLNFFNIKSLNLAKLYFLATFSSLLPKLQTDSKFMAQTLTKLISLSWESDQIKEGLYSLERQIYAPLTEEEKIIHDLYTLEKIGAPEIARALSLQGINHPLFDDIQQNKIQFFTQLGKEIGEERLKYTKQFLDNYKKSSY
ncbi:MAG: GNAT family N-acetyltransferase [Turicibacter sp.]|nr:GNAT family N-acetyltransferase [Turicibacter sp.]